MRLGKLNQKDAVYKIREHIDAGRDRIVCPVCNGGSSGERCMSLYATEDSSTILATCHRASCSFGTQPVGRGNTISERRDPKTPVHLHWRDRVTGTRPLAIDEAKEVVAELGYPIRYTVALKWIEHIPGGLAYPMLDSGGNKRGYVVQPNEPVGPKALSYKDDEYDGMSWYLQPYHTIDGRVILVEDRNSALCAYSAGYSAVSLNGTLLNDPRVVQIMRNSHTAYLMLDADATGKALKYLRRYGSYCNLLVRRLERDLKNMGFIELSTFLVGNVGPVVAV